VRGSAAFRLSVASGGVLIPPSISLPGFDPDARDYIRRVAAADGQPLEPSVQRAIDAFVRGCKADGIWSAIKASCILAGARTLAGALVPLAGTAPTNFDFVAGDYNRETGLVGDGSTKYLDSNRANDADPQDNFHLAVNVGVAPTSSSARAYIGAGGANTGSTQITSSSASPFELEHRCRASTAANLGTVLNVGFIGFSRSQSSAFNSRVDGITQSNNVTSQTPFDGNILVFARENAGTPGLYSNGRFTFYSIGESLDLALLDARVTDLMNLITYSLTPGLPDLSTMDMDAAAYIGGAYRAGGTLS
jgi:hypothetical protein